MPEQMDRYKDINAVLEQLDGYILALAQRNVPRTIVSPDTLDLDVAEIAQNARIKLWRALEKESISNTRAYVRCIVHHESVNMVRAHKHILPMALDDDGELNRGQVLFVTSAGMQDPADAVEQAEGLTESAERAAAAIQSLPARQQQAMICTLKERLDDVLPLVQPLQERHISIMSAQWPQEKADEHRLKASLSTSRKKLRQLLSDEQLVQHA